MANDRIDRTNHYNLAIFDKSQVGIYFDDFVKYLAGTNNSNMSSIDEILYDFEEQMANVKDGDSAYVHIRWGTSETPATLLEIPADYIGIYAGNSATAPASYAGYKWYRYKGEKGDTGSAGLVMGKPPETDPQFRVWIDPEGEANVDEILEGIDGFSPIANIVKVGDTATITITDEKGTTTATIKDGTGKSAYGYAVDGGYTGTEEDFKDELALLNNTTNNSHTHSNKSTLDLTTAAYTTTEKSKLSGIAAGADVSVNADWNASSGKAQILNKPTVPNVPSWALQENKPSYSAADVGLGNVDNTSDLNKPISTATQTALDTKVDNSRILTDVPLNAKFTDTITTINSKTGAISKDDIVALGIPSQDTIYNHPSTHPASMITESSTERFVSDSEKLTWNSKSDTDTVTTINGKTGDISKADIVALGIPAQDTDTTYTEITTDEIDAGTDSTLRTITARRLKYLLDKIVALFPSKTSELTNDSGFLTSVTKNDVGLANVDNVKQMPISGGVLENYREKLVTLSGTSTTINLSSGNVFTHTLAGDTTYSITNAVNSQAHSFTLIINMDSTVRTLTFPASVKWQGGEIPDLSTASKTYVLTFMSIDGGTTWLGMFGGEF